MCNPSSPELKPVAQSTTPDVSKWTPQQIHEFLLKYPTSSKASSTDGASRLVLGYDPSTVWSQVAGTEPGREFLTAHAENRRAAGDAGEFSEITQFLNSTNPNKVTKLPTIPAGAPSAAASSVVRADLPFVGPKDLKIPLLSKSTTPRLPLINPTKY